MPPHYWTHTCARQCAGEWEEGNVGREKEVNKIRAVVTGGNEKAPPRPKEPASQKPREKASQMQGPSGAKP